ncbi:Cyclic di-GMP phosphodiesterase response regulator RpfG [Streptomyces sp. ADI92-24]|uniref:HD-GYP domain-containing protein n=1 Tax=unclassified Streptomyces TaxID=2593676 RepID=UPI000F465CAD|nr:MULTISPECIES: HD-GYP domain-containing protein [unclassified Streptomyces]MCX4769931.1 HD-GYP domain-containing protein [Streptomyces sp. NBC_01285]ROQ82698.1 HD domain-containing protein [Streptomyces sp. CEV 2-1]RPK43574.1 Cyclic di-GMP phosphodiesterase response regulator RpfG [Streptomyces sp. ADI92-24]
MRASRGAARAYILAVSLCATLCVLPALRPGAGTPWTTLGLLTGLYLVCELPGRRPFFGSSVPVSAGSFFPLLLAAAFLLPPAAAALVAIPGSLVGRVEKPPVAARRVWRAAQLVLTVRVASGVHALLGGPAALGGSGPGRLPELPYALLPACAAALAFSLVLSALDGSILAAAEHLPVRRAWSGLLPRSLGPHLVHGLAGLMMAVLWSSSYGPLAALFVLLPMYISGWAFAQYHRQHAAHRATIRALVQAVDIKDTYTRGHSERVGRACVLIAHELGMARDRVEVLRFAGILHDVGKLGVPTRVLRKDGPLTPQERRVIELHPEYGHEIVRGIGFLGEARAAILHHHERLDGSGYPYGLAGREIPEFARVVAVADAFDAMTSTRSYRRGRPVPVAVEELKRCAGTQFDPQMVRALARGLERHGWSGAASAVTADDGRLPVPVSRGGGTGRDADAVAARGPVRPRPPDGNGGRSR